MIPSLLGKVKENINGAYQNINEASNRRVHFVTCGWVIVSLFVILSVFGWLSIASIRNTIDNHGIFYLSSTMFFFVTIIILDIVFGISFINNFATLLKYEVSILLFNGNLWYFVKEGYRSLGDNFFAKQILAWRFLTKGLDWISQPDLIEI